MEVSIAVFNILYLYDPIKVITLSVQYIHVHHKYLFMDV